MAGAAVLGAGRQRGDRDARPARRVAGKPLGELFGPIVRRDVAVYRASGNRGNTPEAEIEYLKKIVAEIGAKAIKFRLGARMRYDDASTRRDQALIPLTRKTFGDAMALYADANSSYDVPMAIKIGRLMRSTDTPSSKNRCHSTTTTRPNRSPTRSAPGRRRRAGISEPSGLPLDDRTPRRRHRPARPVLLRRLHSIDPGGADGGRRRYGLHASHVGRRARIPVCRALRLVRAERRAVPGYKGRDRSLPVSSDTSSLQCVNGMLTVPKGPGLGVTIDPTFVSKGTVVI